MRSRQLLALGARLQQATASRGSAAAGAAAAGSRAALQPAQHPHQLLSLKIWAGSATATAATSNTVQLTAAGRAVCHEDLTASATRWLAAVRARRGLSTGAVARPGPAPRGTSRAGSGRSLWSGLFLLAPGTLAAFLGKWQLDRWEWKTELLERRQAMMQGGPLVLFEAEEEPPEYARVAVEGVFDHAASQYVGPRTRQIAGISKQGFLVVTPLRQQGSAHAVLVNRGWVPAEWREDKGMCREGQPTGKVWLEGIMRHGEDPSTFVPPNEPTRGNWYYINVPELAAAVGLQPQTPLVEVVTVEPGDDSRRGCPSDIDVLRGRGHMPQVVESYPLPKSQGDLMRFSVMPQDHFNYAATWWTLSAATLALAVKAVRQGVKAR